MTGDTVSPATTVSRWADLPSHVRLCGYVMRNGMYVNVVRSKLYTRKALAWLAHDNSYRGLIIKSKGFYYMSLSNDTLMQFTHKSAALAALRMRDD